MSISLETSDDLAVRAAVVAQVRLRQKVWFVVTGVILALVIAGLLVVALGAGNSAMPSLRYDPSTGFTFSAQRNPDVKHFDDGEVLLPGGGAVDCGVGISTDGTADGGLNCDWSSFDPDPTVNALMPTDFMKKYGIVSGKDAGQWCITAKLPSFTNGAPAYQVQCGTQESIY